MKKYETIDHTADLGIKIYGKDAKELFANAGYAFFDLFAELENVRADVEKEIIVEGGSWEDLMIEWLRELLYLAQAEEYIFTEFEIKEINVERLRAIAKGEKIDPDRHHVKTEIKAVTYHELTVEENAEGWTAQVIFDL